MRLLRIFYDWPGDWNGLAPAGYEMTKEQSKLDYKITVMCGLWPSKPVVTIPNVTFSKIIREPIPGSIYFTSSVILFLKYFLWRNKYKVDVIHSHGHFGIWIYLYRSFLKKFRIFKFEFEPVFITHFHNTFKGRWESLKKEGKSISWVSEKIAWPLGIKSDMWALDSSDLCIFVSQNLLEEAVKYYGADRNKCIVLENGVNVELFKKVNSIEKDKTRKELGYDSLDTVILNYGNMVARKNITKLVESLVHLPINYKLLLIGSGSKEYMEEIDKIIIDHLLGSRVKKIPYTPYPELNIPIQSSDIFVLPSDFEGLPKVVLEALACELPCLVSGFKFLEDFEGVFYLDNKDPKHIAEKIDEISRKKINFDIDKYRINFSWHTKMLVLDEIYKKQLSLKNAK
jgi:glycosyltransferase involved in cell wall biosynthesis